METLSNRQSQIAGHTWAIPALLLMASAFSISLMGFEFPYGNNSIHVPIVLDYAGSDEGPHDAYHTSLKNYYSGFWILLSLFVNEDNIYQTFLAFHVLARFLNLSVLYLIVRNVIPNGDRVTAALGVSCLPLFGLALGVTPIGFHGIFGSALSHSAFATTFLLLSWLLALRQQWIVAAMAMGVAFNLNAFVGFWGALVIGSAMLWQEHKHFSLATTQQAAVMAVGFSVVALPTVYWIGASLIDAPDEVVTYDFREFVLAHFPEHNFVHVQYHNLIKIILMVAGIVFLLTSMWRSLANSQRDTLAAFLVAMIAIFIFGCILPYVTDSRLLLLLYPLRIDGFLTFLLFICALSYLSLAFQNAGDTPTNASPHSIIALLSLSHGNLPLLLAAGALDLDDTRWRRFAGATFLALGAYVAVYQISPLHWANASTPLSVATTLQAGWIFVAILCFSTPWLVRHENDAPILAVLYPALAIAGMSSVTNIDIVVWPLTALFVLAGFFFVLPSLGEAMTKPIATVFFVIIIWVWFVIGALETWGPTASLIGLVAGSVSTNWTKLAPRSTSFAFKAPLVLGFLAVGTYAISQSIAQGGLSKQTLLHNAWVETQSWARINSEADSLFLTPKYLSEFATLSRRPVWVDWKSGAAANWQPDYFPEWHARMSDVQKLKTMDEWFGYASTNNIDYIVFRLSTLTIAERESLEFVYRNRVFGIVKAKG